MLHILVLVQIIGKTFGGPTGRGLRAEVDRGGSDY